MPTTFDAQIQRPVADILRAAQDLAECEKAGLLRVETEFQREAGKGVAQIEASYIPSRQAIADYNARECSIGFGTRRKRRRVSSAPAWTHAGNLERAIKAPPIWSGLAAVEVRVNLPYAGPRNDLGMTRQPKHPALGMVRREPFWDNALSTVEDKSESLFSEAFASKWENG